MCLLISKFAFAVIIFALTLATGMIPIKIAKHNVKFLSLCDSFASGIFLSAALLHLLPDAATKLSANISINSSYPIAYLICIISFIAFIIMDRGILIYGKIQFAGNKIIAPFFLLLLLTIHSIVEGAAIGIGNNFLETIAIFFAVFAHKGSESFVLSTNMHRAGLTEKTIHGTIFIFSLTTPLGIFAASSLLIMTENATATLLEAIFCAVAAGTFLYLGTEHLIEGKRSSEQSKEIAALIFGVTMMAVLAIWV